MKICIKAGIILFTILLELLLSNFLVLNAIKPDLILIVVICMSLISGPEEGTAAGFIGGMLKDIFSVHYLGV
ncbi:MAG: rod shape-determining protein MreD, partial [Atribacterota bacterium]|nr:rod shape-determining protein MreD [Atribacterota bacterium]